MKNNKHITPINDALSDKNNENSTNNKEDEFETLFSLAKSSAPSRTRSICARWTALAGIGSGAENNRRALIIDTKLVPPRPERAQRGARASAHVVHEAMDDRALAAHELAQSVRYIHPPMLPQHASEPQQGL